MKFKIEGTFEVKDFEKEPKVVKDDLAPTLRSHIVNKAYDLVCGKIVRLTDTNISVTQLIEIEGESNASSNRIQEASNPEAKEEGSSVPVSQGSSSNSQDC